MLVVADDFLEVHWQFLKQSFLWIKDHAVDHRIGVLGVRIVGTKLFSFLLNTTSFEDIQTLLHHTALHESLMLKGWIRNHVEGLVMDSIHITDRTNPVLEKTKILFGHCGMNCSTVVMPSDDDVLHL